jgi:hypothetical protein
MNWFAILSQSPNPRKRVADMADAALSAAVTEIEAIECPNEFHRAVYALLIGEVLRRWRSGLLSVDLEGHESRVTSQEDEA